MVNAGLSLLALAATVGPATVAGFALSPSTMSSARRSAVSMSAEKQRVLVIGGTRFSGLYLTKELHSRGHEVRALKRLREPPVCGSRRR